MPSVQVLFFNESDATLHLDPGSVQLDGQWGPPPPTEIAPEGVGRWGASNNFGPLMGRCLYRGVLSNQMPAEAMLTWKLIPGQPNQYVIQAVPYPGSHDGGQGDPATVRFFFKEPVQEEPKLSVTFYNQWAMPLTLDPDTTQIQGGEFNSLPPASIPGSGQGTWTMTGSGIKGSCSYSFDSVSGAKLSWDATNNQYSINAYPSDEYTGNTSGSNPSVSFTVQLNSGGGDITGQGGGGPFGQGM